MLIVHDFGFITIGQSIRTMRRTAEGMVVGEASSVEFSRRFGVSTTTVRNVFSIARNNGD
jgi:hypothetical protein